MDASEISAAYFQSDDRRSASMSIPTNTLDSSENEHNLVGFAGPLRNDRRTPLVQMSGPLFANRNHEFIFQPPQIERYPPIDRTENKDWQMDDYAGKNEHLLRSGQLGMCNDPYCTTCPTFYNAKGRQKQSRTIVFHNRTRGDAKGMCSFPHPCIPGIMNPHNKVVRLWNKCFVISCLFAVFLDPFFFFLLYAQEDNKCLVLNWPLTTAIVVLRSMTDFIYLLHILLQFRVAYVASESRVAVPGDLVDDPKKIARHYLFGYFFVDCFVVLPLPQIIILLIIPDTMGDPGANYGKNILRAAILVQYIPRLCRFLHLLGGSSPSGFIFESAWANFVINLLNFVLAGHVVGSCWYLFGLQRVYRCFRDACNESNISRCMEFIDCGHGDDYRSFRNDRTWEDWKKNENAIACFGEGHFDFGIFKTAVNLTTHKSVVTRYVYSLFWGFQQISTLAGNQVPSYFEWEVLFTMAIIAVGLLLFALLIGNMQNFLQALGRRRLEMFLRRHDVEQWMRHRRLPEELRSQVLNSERFNWAATRGVNEEMLMENLPEDLQREIRRHLFKFVKKVRIFQGLDKPIMDAVYERLRTKIYMDGSIILCRGGLVDKMVFIIRGEMESTGGDGIGVSLSEGDVCGEELLTWCLEHSSVNKDGRRIRIPEHRLLSNRDVKCKTNVEAFVLRAADLEEVTSLFSSFLRSPRVEGAIR